MSKEDLENAIGMQLQFYTHSGATMDDTIQRILKRAESYSQQETASLRAEVEAKDKEIERLKGALSEIA